MAFETRAWENSDLFDADAANDLESRISDGLTGGLVLGGDTNLYRSAANTLKTDDAFFAVDQVVASLGTNQVNVGAVGPGFLAGLTFGMSGDTNLYRSAADTLKTDDTFRSAAALGTAHVAAVTPTGGASGDIKIGNGKIWVNDAGTWKSVAVA
jgi:hypothetical protein